MMPDKLNLGCGHDYREGYVNLDNGKCRADVYHDMNVVPYPFPDDRFIHIFSNHSLEHVQKSNWIPVVEELYRISAPDATWEIRAPYALSDNFFTDPTHNMPLTPRSFDYFDRTKTLRELGEIYSYIVDLRVLDARLVKNKPYGPDVHFRIRVVKGNPK